MTLRKISLTTIMLLLQTAARSAGVVEAAPSHVMVVSYWGYIAFLPAMIAGLVLHCCLVRAKR